MLQFLINEYPNKYLKKYLLKTKSKKINRNNKPIDSVIKLSFINENLSFKMQTIKRGTTLDINPRIIFKTQKPLVMILQKEKRNLCGQKCTCENHNMCLKKNIVFKTTCTLCEDAFIGEASRKMITRINEHPNQKFSEVLLGKIKHLLH